MILFIFRSIRSTAFLSRVKFRCNQKQFVTCPESFALYTTTTTAPSDQIISAVNATDNKCQNDQISYSASDRGRTHEIAPSNKINENFKKLFSISLPEGHCIGIQYQPSSNLSCQNICPYLQNEEIKYCESLPSTTSKITFSIGRIAMHLGLNEISYTENFAILKDEYGRPILPKEYIGSISHKKNIGVALVNNGTRNKGIGIDIEQTFANRQNIDKRILTRKEIEELGCINGVTRDEEVLLRFR